MKSTIALVGAEWFHSIFFTTNNFDSRLNHTQNVLTTFSCSTRPVLQIILTRAWITLKFFLPFIPTTCPHTAWNERSVTWLLLKHLYLFGESRIGLSCIISRKQTHFCIANTRPIEQIPYTSSIPHIATTHPLCSPYYIEISFSVSIELWNEAPLIRRNNSLFFWW